jgi:hypothetical protein
MKTYSIFSRKVIFYMAFGVVGILLLSQHIYSQKEKGTQRPDVNIRVNKHFDKDGNITSYDSTYSYQWSSQGEGMVNIDSIFSQYENIFNNQGFFRTQPNINDSLFGMNPSYFFNDSIMYNSIHNNIMNQFETMMRNQEALMEQFFNRNYHQKPILRAPEGKDSEQKVLPQKQSYSSGIEL